jgi:cyclophilin family peptidyl-prolyl cis-trans isomerase/protein-disulfide isomerase
VKSRRHRSAPVVLAATGALLTVGLSSCASAPTAAPTAMEPTRAPIQLGPTATSAPTASPPLRPEPTATPLPLPLPGPDDWALGPAGAPIVFLIYSDFQSPNAALGLGSLLDVQQRHPESVRLVFRHFPVLAEYDKDSLAGQAAEAAGRQGLFWSMVRMLATRHGQWSVLPPEGFSDWLQEQAPSVGLDVAMLGDDLASGRYAGLMVQAFQDATGLGVPGVPTILLNGIPLRISPTPLQLEAAVRLELLAARQYSEAPETTLDRESGYTATIRTRSGELVIQLFPQSAPAAVNSFIFLAEEGFFDGTAFFRVEPGVMAEAGDPSGTGLGDPGYHLPDEIDPTLTFDSAGMVALSSAGPGTNGSRFFISLKPLPSLTGNRTIFGRVIEGLELLEGLEARDPALDLLEPGAAILRSVQIERSP